MQAFHSGFSCCICVQDLHAGFPCWTSMQKKICEDYDVTLQTCGHISLMVHNLYSQIFFCVEILLANPACKSCTQIQHENPERKACMEVLQANLRANPATSILPLTAKLNNWQTNLPATPALTTFVLSLKRCILQPTFAILQEVSPERDDVQFWNPSITPCFTPDDIKQLLELQGVQCEMLRGAEYVVERSGITLHHSQDTKGFQPVL